MAHTIIHSLSLLTLAANQIVIENNTYMVIIAVKAMIVLEWLTRYLIRIFFLFIYQIVFWDNS